MNFTLNIQAPGLENALNNLASALQGNVVNVASVVSEPQSVPQHHQHQPMPEQIQQPAAVPTSTPVQQPMHQVQGQQPMAQPPVQQQQPMPQQTVPTSQTSYSMDQLAVAATQLMDAGKREQLMQLLATFGVQALTTLPQEQYGAFATKLRELGANI
ncbi:hypothetical protein FCT18_17175 [Lysinibacillus sphaericus]|uniref:Uncharacterized protein n=1 Tax=Lysinibacillus sphaericus TaxID=1421 RepID=A0A2S0JWS1_LYSSH|nr:hypothetical protein [Lysinibacillus sphaericus]AVK95587.1 hypothetical protein LS41612_04510 [Lysinibacillus sphaericus]MED4546483.1 hypothetical protein [Lysinibacillus sphaericus]TKI17660.1 hypothetical protein FCT18_17175 [Lysinibacillus sphaericus]SUV18721.1 Uncharacterised protein [Lysinibacillus sphaericus]GEC84487.1 hypothetical protein LSP03_42300 [Lysinibacillus sphaericus]